MESKLQKRVLQYLKTNGIYAIKVIQATKTGIPDIICCLNGKFVAIELKSPKNNADKLQEYNIKQIQESGGIAFCSDNYEEIVHSLEVIFHNVKKGL